MKKSESMIAGTIAGLLALPAGAIAAEKPTVHCFERERCYGVVKAGQNDCATAASSCAGTARLDYQKDAWVYLPKGMCVRLGGTVQPPNAAKSGSGGK
jgi:uncharacterized membrane protein